MDVCCRDYSDNPLGTILADRIENQHVLPADENRAEGDTRPNSYWWTFDLQVQDALMFDLRRLLRC